MLNISDDIESMRDLSRWERPVHGHASLDAFLATKSLQDGIHAIAYRGVYLEFNLHRRASKSMLVFFNAALSSRTSDVKLPAFSGTRAPHATDACVLMVSDPGLYLDRDIRLAWYAGASGMRLQEDMAKVLRHIQDVLSIARMVLYGASGGGFAALYYAPFLRNAIAVPCNPQINLLIYSPGILGRYLRTAYGYKGAPSAFESADIPDRPTVRIRPEHVRGSRIVYLQNALDARHFNREFLPFLHEQGFSRGRGVVEVHSDRLVSVCGDNWGEGHRAPPAKFVYDLLHSLTKTDGWDRLPETIPALYARTANRFRQVVLKLENGGFTAQAVLHEPQGEDEITMVLYRDDIEIETIRVASAEFGRFSCAADNGRYRVTARAARDHSTEEKTWGDRLLSLFRTRNVFDEMRSRVVVVG
ncbi:hypothetical protein H4684_001204 [Desulfomicrobium macestii]|uniref:Uncharacterized protein n=1 Tax=Desulfomicrobium macestii TaxID=90731 RepID=A0ABR9H1J6_9BACT|nr:hypothetical protein [Desulfomicrobium macestii]MBE1424572.1 hypothetical protein [Desulfomicrobium macestii]